MALTDRKTANLQASEKKYRHLFEHSPVGIFVTDRNGNLININTSGAQLLGFDSLDQMAGRSLSSFFSDPADRDIYQGLLGDGNLVSEFETRLCKCDLTCIDVKIRTSVRNTLSGKPRKNIKPCLKTHWPESICFRTGAAFPMSTRN